MAKAFASAADTAAKKVPFDKLASGVYAYTAASARSTTATNPTGPAPTIATS